LVDIRQIPTYVQYRFINDDAFYHSISRHQRAPALFKKVQKAHHIGTENEHVHQKAASQNATGGDYSC
jgi:hypothetical protein